MCIYSFPFLINHGKQHIKVIRLRYFSFYMQSTRDIKFQLHWNGSLTKHPSKWSPFPHVLHLNDMDFLPYTCSSTSTSVLPHIGHFPGVLSFTYCIKLLVQSFMIVPPNHPYKNPLQKHLLPLHIKWRKWYTGTDTSKYSSSYKFRKVLPVNFCPDILTKTIIFCRITYVYQF